MWACECNSVFYIHVYTTSAIMYMHTLGVGEWKDTESQCIDKPELTEPLATLLEPSGWFLSNFEVL